MRLNENVKIIGKNVILVPYESHHVPKYHDWMEDEEIRRLTGSERLSLEQEYDMQRTWRTDEDKLTFIILSKSLADKGLTEVTFELSVMFSARSFELSLQIESMIGDVNLFIQLEDSAGELEIMIAEKTARGTGAGTEAASLMISYALKELEIKKFFVKVTDDNQASLHLFEDKLKFRRVSHSDVFGEYTLELPESEMCSFREILHTAYMAPYRE
ncbi:unnamed protein product [Cylicostephanus goldi]|uniref:N-acetyltransferase domain-containing protein n=1 Tax=Cylicostephanus goldi TaxID=71465 RepID=A0A3P6R430_CYLGO|nr:unnamed protein product [Cylicostephanus goldi]